MHTYKFKFSKGVIALLIALLVLGIAAIVFTVYRMFIYGFSSVSLVIQYVVLIIFGLLAIIVVISMLIRSVYKVTEKEIVLWFGIIKSSYKIKDIESIHLFTKTNKLVLYFKNEKYTIVVVNPAWYNEFIKDVLSHNLNIRYDVSISEKDDEE